MKQCGEKVVIELTDLEYICVKQKGHDGPHHIAISSDFNVVDAKHDRQGLFGVCECERLHRTGRFEPRQ